MFAELAVGARLLIQSFHSTLGFDAVCLLRETSWIESVFLPVPSC